MKHLTLFTALLALIALVGCEEDPPARPKATKAPTPPVVKKDDPKKTPAATEAPKGGEKLAGDLHPKLLDPKDPELNQTAPAEFKVKFDTTQGKVIIKVTREWAPNGADRFFNLVKGGFYDGCRFFRVLDGFMAQFGLNGDPRVSAVWKGAMLKDDPVLKSNTRGKITYAMAGPNTRTSQLFINYADRNAMLDAKGFSPFGEVIEGMEVMDSIYKGYGETPSQGRIQNTGNEYLNAEFPNLDYIKTATVIE